MNSRLEEVIVRLSRSEWFDGYHIHPSLFGYKKRNLKLICEIETSVRSMLSKNFQELQCFILLDMQNSDYDAIYLHTRNKNQTPFPIALKQGIITRHVDLYNGIISTLTSRGYTCFKLKGKASIVATHDTIRS